MSPAAATLKAPVLMYHHVERLPLVPPPVFADSYIDRAEFAAQLDLLARKRLRTLTLADAVERAARGETLRGTVVLTFDDGCRCFADHAAPELARRGMTATLFALAGRFGATNDWDAAAGERSEHLLDAAMIRALAAQGFEVGCHGFDHRDLTLCDDAALRHETAEARSVLGAALGQPVRTFCYPYGRLDRRSRAAVEVAGFTAAAAIFGHPLARADDLFAIPRMILRPHESPFELLLKARGRYALWSRMPRLGLLRALRRKAPR